MTQTLSLTGPWHFSVQREAPFTSALCAQTINELREDFAWL